MLYLTVNGYRDDGITNDYDEEFEINSLNLPQSLKGFLASWNLKYQLKAVGLDDSSPQEFILLDEEGLQLATRIQAELGLSLIHI